MMLTWKISNCSSLGWIEFKSENSKIDSTVALSGLGHLVI